MSIGLSTMIGLVLFRGQGGWGGEAETIVKLSVFHGMC